MSESSTIATDRPARIGPGRLILVIGPSGAGKDTLLHFARVACAAEQKIVFARRIVTREASSSEDNRQLDPKSFRSALARGEFAVNWEAHGNFYALPREIDDDIRAGRIVVANVSRMVVDLMRGAYADVLVIEITAPPEVLAERLAMRARGSDGDIELRLLRSVEAVPDVRIVNVGDPETHARQLSASIRGELKHNVQAQEGQDNVDHLDDRTA